MSSKNSFAKFKYCYNVASLWLWRRNTYCLTLNLETFQSYQVVESNVIFLSKNRAFLKGLKFWVEK